MEKNFKETTKAVLVKNLSCNVRCDHIDEIFSNFGEIKDIKLAYFKGHSAGWAFVFFANHSEALKAIEMMDEGNIDGNVISVSLADTSLSIEETYIRYHNK